MSMAANNRFLLWGYKTLHRLLKHDFIRFCVVGASGFCVNLFFLTLLHALLDIHVTPAQIISAEIALLSNFSLHNMWTYKDHKHLSFLGKLWRFHMSSWGGIVITTVIVSLGVEKLGLNYLIALVFASAIALFWNFVWTKFFIFKSSRPNAEIAAESVLPTAD